MLCPPLWPPVSFDDLDPATCRPGRGRHGVQSDVAVGEMDPHRTSVAKFQEKIYCTCLQHDYIMFISKKNLEGPQIPMKERHW